LALRSALTADQPPALRSRPPPTKSGRLPSAIPLTTKSRYLRRASVLRLKMGRWYRTCRRIRDSK
jgi:hypothetical protein